MEPVSSGHLEIISKGDKGNWGDWLGEGRRAEGGGSKRRNTGKWPWPLASTKTQNCRPYKYKCNILIVFEKW
jgi:hypothetical protein